MRRHWLIFGILLLALAPSAHLAWKSRDMAHLGHYHDDGIYWVTAKSLAEGNGYRILSLPDQPYQTKYPPLYPLLLSAVWKLNPAFPGNLSLAIWLAWLMLPVFLMLARFVLQDLGLDGLRGWVLCAIMAVSPAVVLLSINLMSDLLFCCLLFASLTLTHQASRRGAWMAVAAGLLAGAAYLTRAAALPLLAAGPLWFALRKQYSRAALYAIAMAPAVAGWSLWTRAHMSPSSDLAFLYYTNYFGYQFYNLSWSDVPLVVYKNLNFVLVGLSQLLVGNAGESFWWDFYFRLFVFASIAGIAREVRKHGLTAYHLFAAGFVPLLLVCRWPADGRAVLVLFPLLLAGLRSELDHVAGMLKKSLRRPALGDRIKAVTIGAVLVLSAGWTLRINSEALFRIYPAVIAQRRELLHARRSGYQWISRNLPTEANFLAYDDTILYLYTDHRACSIRIPPQAYYSGDENAVAQLYQTAADFSQNHNLTHLLTTAGDYYRDNITPSQRVELQRKVDESRAFRLLYASSMVSVRSLVEGSH